MERIYFISVDGLKSQRNILKRTSNVMKALSIQQPWAWLVANGLKDIENRGWRTHFKGRIYIHAGVRTARAALSTYPVNREGFLQERVVSTIREILNTWKHSAIIGEVDIVDCVTNSDSPWFTGRFGFVLANPAAYDHPIPCRGRTYFFTPDI